MIIYNEEYHEEDYEQEPIVCPHGHDCENDNCSYEYHHKDDVPRCAHIFACDC
jgi:hypothetical protein